MTPFDLRPTVEAIGRVQAPDGHIPWVPGGKTDPWNMVEAAMALDVGGRSRQLFGRVHDRIDELRQQVEVDPAARTLRCEAGVTIEERVILHAGRARSSVLVVAAP